MQFPWIRPKPRVFRFIAGCWKRQIILVENLNRLQDLPQSGFTFFALPLRIKDGDGSPVRAVAMFI